MSSSRSAAKTSSGIVIVGSLRSFIRGARFSGSDGGSARRLVMFKSSSFGDAFSDLFGSDKVGIFNANSFCGPAMAFWLAQMVLSPSLSIINNQEMPVISVKPTQQKHSSNNIVPGVLKYGINAELITSPTNPPALKLNRSSKLMLAIPLKPSNSRSPPTIRSPIVR